MLFVFAASIFFAALRKRPVQLALSLGVAIACQQVAWAASDLVDLRPTTPVGSCRLVKAVIEVEGKLKLNADGKEVQHLPLKVQGQMQYAERVLSQAKQWSEVRLARSYESARADIRLRDSDLKNSLRPERKLIVVESSASQPAAAFSPLGPLTREELELIETPASGLALEALLPLRALKIGGQWTLESTTVARLLGLEAVSQHDVACTLDSVKDNLAIVSLAGKIAGAIGGVSSDIELKGKLNYDLKQRTVTWLTLACKENRDVGHAQPGFEVVTTLRLVAAPVKSASDLGDKALADLPLKANQGQLLLDLTAEAAGFKLLHDRRWSVMFERGDVTVLRLVDRGDLIAQCNISPRPPLGPGEQLTLAGFQEDVKRVLGKNFEQIVEASEEASDAQIRILRVVVAGKAGDLPIQWTYYHLLGDHGHRASLVFTIESTLLERFAAIDRELIDGFRFTADKQPKSAATPTLEGPSLR
jgi:hypothetical protein